MEPSVNGGLKFYTNGCSLLTKMAAIAIFGKNTLKSSFSEARML